MTAIVLLAPSPVTQKHAERLSAQLAAAGFKVGHSDAQRVRGVDVDAADKVVLLWSKDAARGPALRAAARRARADGKLICARLDSARPPKEAGRAIAAPRGRNAARTWARLIGATRPAAMAPSRATTLVAPTHDSKTKKSRGGGWLVGAALAGMAAAAGLATYFILLN
jgi:hypothetical protein